MSKYNESIKAILTEVESFLAETIKSVSLSRTAEKQKQSILGKLDVLREEYPNLLPRKPGTVSIKPPTDDDSGNTGSSLEDGNDGEELSYGENIANMSAGEASAGCTRSGTLLKKRKTSDLRSKLTPFQKRWCIVKNNIFYYYEKPSDKQQKGAFSLAGYEFRDAPFVATGKEANKKELGFQLYKLGDRTYEFLAASKQDMKEWKQALEKSIQEKAANSTPPGMSNVPDPYAMDEEIYEPIAENLEPEPTSNSKDESFRPSSIYTDAASATSTPIKSEVGSQERRPPPDEPKKKRVVPDCKNWKVGVDNDYKNMYYCKWDCKADADNELGFKKGDMIHVLSKEFDAKSWWIAELKGDIGLVPKRYLAEAYERICD